MKKLLLVCLVAIVATGCEGIQKSRVEGTYKLLKGDQLSDDFVLEVGESMATYKMTLFASAEVSSEYKIEDNYLYLTSPQTQIRLRIADTDTLVLENSFLIPTGKYVKAQ
jgi:hypothetical protein